VRRRGGRGRRAPRTGAVPAREPRTARMSVRRVALGGRRDRARAPLEPTGALGVFAGDWANQQLETRICIPGIHSEIIWEFDLNLNSDF